ncbi:MAG: hypothetical protein WCW35_02590 [Bacteroidota bacterium]|jgi:hypothetical protein
MTKIIVLIVASLFQTVFSQILEKPIFEFERYSWGEHFHVVKKNLKNKSFINIDPSRSVLKPNKPSASIDLAYAETICGQNMSIGLTFSAADSALELVSLYFLGIDPESKGRYQDNNKRIESLMTFFSNLYGPLFKEKSIPFVGEIRIWNMKETDIQLLNLSNAESLIIQYSPK